MTESALRKRERFVCQSASCGLEIEVEPSPPSGGISELSGNPRCSCGSETKRVYSKPVLRELSRAEAIVFYGYDALPKEFN
jgi:hypothetical protein